jgi:hypothetical protein
MLPQLARDEVVMREVKAAASVTRRTVAERIIVSKVLIIDVIKWPNENRMSGVASLLT